MSLHEFAYLIGNDILGDAANVADVPAVPVVVVDHQLPLWETAAIAVGALAAMGALLKYGFSG